MKDNNKESLSEELRPITYISKLKNLSRIRTLTLNVLKSSEKLLKLSKLKSPIALIKELKVLRKSKKIIAASHEINHSIHKVASHKLHSLLNTIAMAYVIYDTIEKAYSVKNKGIKYSTIVAIDTLLFHFFASNVIPGLVINFLIDMNKLFFKNVFPSFRFIPQAGALLALLSIPIMIKPVDIFTDYCLEKTIRKYFNVTVHHH